MNVSQNAHTQVIFNLTYQYHIIYIIYIYESKMLFCTMLIL